MILVQNGKFVHVHSCIHDYLLNTSLYRDGTFIPLDTARIDVHKNAFKDGDIPITVGAVNLQNKLYMFHG